MGYLKEVKTVFATPVKLSDSKWGAKVVGGETRGLERNEVVLANVRTRDGKEWTKHMRVVRIDDETSVVLLGKFSNLSSTITPDGRHCVSPQHKWAFLKSQGSTCPDCGFTTAS